MDIQLNVHFEPVGSDEWVWWADSDQVPGFTAAADHLKEMLKRARLALEAEGVITRDSKVTTLLVPAEPPSEPAALNDVRPDVTAPKGPEGRQSVKVRGPLVPA